ncbi:MAG: hypothetical protein WCI75_20235 [candidate division NC10 bacterium]
MRPTGRLLALSCVAGLLAAASAASEPDPSSLSVPPRSAQAVLERLERTQEDMSRGMDELTTLLQKLELMKDSCFKSDDPRRLAPQRERLSADIRARLDGLGSSRKRLVAMRQMYDVLMIAETGRRLNFTKPGEIFRGTGEVSAAASIDAASRIFLSGRTKLFEGQVSAFASKAEAAVFSEQAAFRAAVRTWEERRRMRMFLLCAALALVGGAAAWLLARGGLA